MRNIKMIIEFDGTRYKGWQVQSTETSTIGEKFNKLLSKMTGEEIKVIGCGRTDSGVHAENYIANFKTNDNKTLEEMFNYINEYLPEDIVLKDIREASDRFHSRYNIVSKTYVYRINNNLYHNVFDRRYTLHVKEKLNVEDMIIASKSLVGTHDFKSFTTLKSKNKSTVRTINYINISENNGYIELEFNGNGFLQRMVRIITGTLIEIGLGKRKKEDIITILEAKKRSEAGFVALAHGLSMKEIKY
ncbi:tRNA pseudouridine(38-40) synthase TruA [Clostridium chrysemydis]|uniref:tRNA pseudouridine(38-40) synthase TruA n=1 Tax=Clostridium chrysemydis TaxID=2665504 RepID=UPI0018832B99|nr:tRNA pseudouridine(38-40) synthase TruA [Clostridium chrysemydis]